MKLLFITSWYPDEQNPVQGIFVQAQARKLSTTHDVTVVSFKVDKNNFSLRPSVHVTKNETGRLTEYRLVVSRFLPVVNQFSYMYLAYQFIKKLMKEKTFDLIHAHVSYPAGVVALQLSKTFNIPYVLTEHSSPFESLFRSRIHKFLALSALKSAGEVAAVSAYTAERIKAHTGRTTEVVYEIVSTSSFKPESKLKSDKIIIGFAGMLTSTSTDQDKKGLDILLKALAALERKDWVLWLVGDGPLLAIYKDMVDKLGLTSNVQFKGVLKPDEMPAFFREIDFFVLSSRDESFGIVLIEAMASGKPVVSTKCGGPEEIVTEISGILCEKESVSSLSGAINNMLDTYTEYKPDLIWEYVENTFSERAFAIKIEKIYLDLLSKTNKTKTHLEK